MKSFFDSNDDGIGDFPGLTSKLGYIRDLGVNTIWLMPFYPSPLKDDGYDIADYQNVHPQYGTLDDFRAMLREAHRLGLKVVTELVINHTSDQHPWFQAARHAPPGSPERDFYVWSDTDQKYLGTRIIFIDTETSNWTWDPVAKAYYWHRFFSHQPDLNFDNPLVMDAVLQIMRFWLDMGVDGFRLDAIPYLVEREGTNNENLRETHAVIKQLRAAIDAHYQNRFLLAEANQWPEDVREYFGDGDECHMAYHFPLMPRIYMSIAQEDRYPITEIMQQTPDIPDSCQWAIFLRNHDELTLEMVTSKERDYMYTTYAADVRARINLGIRRRLAPLMENDHDRIKLMNSLLLSMPGSPILYYGDEIGMGDNVFIGDRNGVRTPMQWSPDRNAGFSRADPQRLYLPPIMDPVYGYPSINVEAQLRDPSSLLSWTKRMLAVRKTSQAFGRGTRRFLRPGNRKILAYLREYGEDSILCVANLSRSAQPVELNLASFKGRVPVEMLGRTTFPPIGDLPYLLTLVGVRLLLVQADPRRRGAVVARTSLCPSTSARCWCCSTAGAACSAIGWCRGASAWRRRPGCSSRPTHCPASSRLSAGMRRRAPPSSAHASSIRWCGRRARPAGSSHCSTSSARREAASYFMPLALAWEDRDEDRVRDLRALRPSPRCASKSNVGVMGDAFADELFCRALVAAMAKRLRDRDRAGQAAIPAEPRPSRRLAGSDFESLPAARPQGSSSNTVVVMGERLILKGYRRLRAGASPELEMGLYLTEVVHYRNCAPLAGVLEYTGNDGETQAARAAAGLRRQSRRRLDVLSRVSAAPSRGTSHGARHRCAARQRARGVSQLDSRAGGAHRRIAHARWRRPREMPRFDPQPLTRRGLRRLPAARER